MTCRMFARQRTAATIFCQLWHTLSEGDSIAGTAPGDQSETDDNGDPAGESRGRRSPVPTEDQNEFPSGELPHPPVVAQPIAAELDEEKNRGD